MWGNDNMKGHIVILLLLLLIAGCSKAQAPAPEPGSVDSAIASIKETAKSITQSEAANATKQAAENASQTVFVPIRQSLPADAVVASYKAPCLLEKYKFLNIYCSSKNVWHNYATVTSWYVSYSVILLLLIIFLVLWWLSHRGK